MRRGMVKEGRGGEALREGNKRRERNRGKCVEHSHSMIPQSSRQSVVG